MWYLNPKNILLMVLAVLVIVVGGLYLWQRNTVVKQAGQIDALTITNKELSGQVVIYKKNIADMKKTQKEQQRIADETASLMAYVSQMKESKCLGVKDEKTLSDITFYFNSRGLLTASDNSADRKGMSEASSADITGWTIKQMTENQLILVDYILKLEKTVNCYETGN